MTARWLGVFGRRAQKGNPGCYEFPIVVMLASIATIAAFAMGISSMARDGEVGHLSSGQWMAPRALLQVPAHGQEDDLAEAP
ncbi:MAG: hypothetical protein GZ089_00500 [Aromatoleum sp.]|nr:hypothetical protein [Aromatoleum sp.]